VYDDVCMYKSSQIKFLFCSVHITELYSYYVVISLYTVNVIPISVQTFTSKLKTK